MSQVSSQIHDSNLVSVPFVKFSHNTSPYGSRNFIWNHIGQRDDLNLVIQNNRVIDGQGNYAPRVMLKVTAGVDALETQDLGELVTFAREFDHSSGAEHPVQVVVRCPFMAMKYPKSVNSVRRIQLKFRNEADFRQALSILTDLGFPITESGSNSTSICRPSISPAQLPFSSTSTPNPAIEASSFQLLSTRQHRPNAGNLSPRPDFKIPIRPDTRNSETTRPSSVQSFATTSFNRPTSASTILSAPTPPSSVSTPSPVYDVTRQPAMFSPAQLQEGSKRPSCPAIGTACTINALGNTFHPSQHQTQHESYRTSIPDSLLGASPFFARPSAVTLNSSPVEFDRWSQPIGQATGVLHSEQQEANPLELTDMHDDWLPPPRELPFPKPRESDRGQRSSAPDHNPLPKPTPVRAADSQEQRTIPTNKSTPTPTPKPTTKRVAQRKPPVKRSLVAKLPSAKRPEMSAVTESCVNGEADGPEDEGSPLAAKSNAARPPSTALGLQSKATAAKKRSAPARPTAASKKPKMVDQCTQTQTLSGRDHTTALALISSNESSAPITTKGSSGPPLPQSYLELIDTLITRNQSGPAPKELWERPSYAEADEEQRQLILNDFICENLENPEFLQLCADTEKAWRRIGLGM